LLLCTDWWNKNYFNYHHTHADTIDKIDPTHLIQNIQVFTAMSYLLADIEKPLARGPIKAADALDDLPHHILKC
jgi:hypothetical protein